MTFKDLLRQKDIHAAQLARKLNLHRATVSKWCTKQTKPKIKYVPIIAEFLGVTVEEVLACFTN